MTNSPQEAGAFLSMPDKAEATPAIAGEPTAPSAPSMVVESTAITPGFYARDAFLEAAEGTPTVEGILASIGSNVERDPATEFTLGGIVTRQNVSAFLVVTVIGPNRTPLIGAKVCNHFPDTNGEIVQTDGNGNARFQFGGSSAFTNPGTGPFTVFVVDDSAYKDTDSEPKRIVYKSKRSDTVHSLGDFQGQHTEIYLQFVLRGEVPTDPPPTPPPATGYDFTAAAHHMAAAAGYYQNAADELAKAAAEFERLSK